MLQSFHAPGRAPHLDRLKGVADLLEEVLRPRDALCDRFQSHEFGGVKGPCEPIPHSDAAVFTRRLLTVFRPIKFCGVKGLFEPYPHSHAAVFVRRFLTFSGPRVLWCGRAV